MKTAKNTAPKVGMIFMHGAVRCRIARVYPLGTIDVVAVDGSGAWRITGLPF